MIAVAGTATSVAAIEQRARAVRPERVHGHVVTRAATEAIRDRLAAMTDAQRRAVPGFTADRAPTIVAGCVLLSRRSRRSGWTASRSARRTSSTASRCRPPE